MTPDSSFVTISDDEIDAPDCLTGPPVSSSEDCSEGVVDVGLVDGEFDAEDVEADDASDAEEAAVDPADASDAEEDGDSSAQATPGEVAIAPPMPSATASAPTRPMYLEYIVGLELAELAEREPSESAVLRLAVGPARPLRRGGHAESASDRAGKGSRTEGFECRFKDVAGFMTHPHGSPPTAVFAVTIASKADAMRGLP